MVFKFATRGLCVLLAVSVLGCGSDDNPVTPAPQLPANDTPENAIQLLIEAYEGKMLSEYESVLTKDFSFEFSNAADPHLAAEYASGWTKTDEIIAAGHLFAGTVTPDGEPLWPANSIAVGVAPSTPQPDNDLGADPVRQYVLLAAVDAVIILREADDPEPTSYLIEQNVHRFFLVRGDVAQLDAGQPADSLHWYVYAWRDETVLHPAMRQATRVPTPAQTTTWGRVKAVYRSGVDPVP